MWFMWKNLLQNMLVKRERGAILKILQEINALTVVN